MQINVSQLLQEPIGATREYEIDEVADIIDDGEKYRVQGECRLLRTQRSILVKCALDTEVALTCCRCLSKLRHPMKIKFEEEFFPTVDILSGARIALPDEPGTFTVDERHTLDITEAVRQYTLMGIPMKALCNEGCSGLCHNCGKNLIIVLNKPKYLIFFNPQNRR